MQRIPIQSQQTARMRQTHRILRHAKRHTRQTNASCRALETTESPLRKHSQKATHCQTTPFTETAFPTPEHRQTSHTRTLRPYKLFCFSAPESHHPHIYREPPFHSLPPTADSLWRFVCWQLFQGRNRQLKLRVTLFIKMTWGYVS
jgi:hypothetical protein